MGKVKLVFPLLLTVLNGIFDSPKAIPDSILDLGHSVLVGAFHQQSDWQWVLALLNKSILIFSL